MFLFCFCFVLFCFVFFFAFFMCFFPSFNSVSLIHIPKLRTILFNIFVTIYTTAIIKEKN